MKVLVTGGTGFLGKHLVRELNSRGSYTITAVPSNYVDLKDYEATEGFINTEEPDYIIHAAAVCGGIGANKNQPVLFLSDNTLINLNVVNVANKYFLNTGKLKKFVGLGSVCEYPKFCPVPFKESDIWNGYPEETNAPYGLTKRMMSVHINACRQQYNFPGIFLIPVNLYGPEDHFDLQTSHVIPAIIRKFYEAIQIESRIVECWGTGKASREFLYVKDAVKGICDALEKYDKPDPVNLGNGREVTIREIVDIIAKMFDYQGMIFWDSKLPDGQPRRCLDVSKAKEEFGFEAKTTLEQGLKETIDWYINKEENK